MLGRNNSDTLRKQNCYKSWLSRLKRAVPVFSWRDCIHTCAASQHLAVHAPVVRSDGVHDCFARFGPERLPRQPRQLRDVGKHVFHAVCVRRRRRAPVEGRSCRPVPQDVLPCRPAAHQRPGWSGWPGWPGWSGWSGWPGWPGWPGWSGWPTDSIVFQAYDYAESHAMAAHVLTHDTRSALCVCVRSRAPKITGAL